MLLRAVSVLFLTTSSTFAFIDYRVLRRAEDGLLKPPQAPLNFDLKPEEIPGILKGALDDFFAAQSKVTKLDEKDYNFTSVSEVT